MFSSLTTIKSESYASSALLFSAVSLTTYIIIKTLSLKKDLESNKNGLPLPPSLPSVPLLGSFPFMGSVYELPKFFKKTADRLGPVFSVTIGSKRVVILNTREVIYEAFIRKAGAFSGRLSAFTTTTYLNPKRYGIIGRQYGPEFRKLHQITLSILKEYGFGSKLMQERILLEIDELILLIKETNQKAIDPGHLFSLCTVNVIASIAFGTRLSQRNADLSLLSDNFRDFMQESRRKIDACPALRFLPQFKAMIQRSVKAQEWHLEYIDKYARESLSSERESFVKRFVEMCEEENYDRTNLNFVIRDLLIAGSDTTSTTVQFAMIRMANNPEMQKRIQLEIDSTVQKDEHVTLDDIPKMPYTEATIYELLRTQPIAPLGLPHYTLEDSELAGYFIPQGTVVYPNIYSAHMDTKMWDNPEEFRPERFLDDQGRLTGKERIITFSLGKRSCLGELLARQELLLIITNLIHKFNILPPEGQERVDVKEIYLLTIFPEPYQLRFLPR